MTLSVILCVYNGGSRLRPMIESILNQTFRDFELICIDDGSTDESGAVCDSFRTDERVTVIHKENSGVGLSRLLGIQKAKGDYITFADADDFLHPQMYEIMYYMLQTHHLDIVMCGYQNAESLEKIEVKPYDHYVDLQPVMWSHQERYEKLTRAMAKNGSVFLWNKFYPAETLRNAVPDYSTEDIEFNTRVFHRVERFGVVELPLYFYINNPDSISRSKFGRFQYSTIIYDFNCEKYAEEHLPEMHHLTLIALLKRCISYRMLSKGSPFEQPVRELLKKEVPAAEKRLWKNRKIPLYLKLKNSLFYHIPILHDLPVRILIALGY